MLAVRINQHGGPDRLVFEEVPDPSPGPGEVRVAVRASAVNHLDLWVRRGVPGHTFPLPMTPGCDAAGVIDQVGSGVLDWHEGDEVVVAPGLSCARCDACLAGADNLCRAYGILGETRDGAQATYVVVPARNVMRRPANLSMAEAAAFSLTFLTAWTMLVVRAALRPAEWVLIHAAGSGVSSAGIQIARLLGARVIATAGHPRKLAAASSLGAHHVIDYSHEDFGSRVRDITSHQGVDVVFDHVGAATFPASIRALARGGRYVFCGATSGSALEADFRRIFFRNISILGSTMGSQGDLRRIRELMEDGRLHPVVDRVLPLEQVAQAHSILEERGAFGKLILSMDHATNGPAGAGVA